MPALKKIETEVKKLDEVKKPELKKHEKKKIEKEVKSKIKKGREADLRMVPLSEREKIIRAKAETEKDLIKFKVENEKQKKLADKKEKDMDKKVKQVQDHIEKTLSEGGAIKEAGKKQMKIIKAGLKLILQIARDPKTSFKRRKLLLEKAGTIAWSLAESEVEIVPDLIKLMLKILPLDKILALI